MYAAKRQASGWAVYEAAQDPHSPRRLALMTELGEAIRKSHLVLAFPAAREHFRAAAHGGGSAGPLAAPTLGLVPPSQFVPLAEMSDSIRPLTWWVLEAALAQRGWWAAQGMSLRVAVNFSARHLLDDSVPAHVERLLARYGTTARTGAGNYRERDHRRPRTAHSTC